MRFSRPTHAPDSRARPAELPIPPVALDDGRTLVIEQLARTIAGRRASGTAVMDERRVFAKVFQGPSRRRHASREVEGGRRLAHAGIPSPKVLDHATGRWHGAAVEVVIFEALSPGRTVNADPQSNALAIARHLAQWHAAGLCQRDLHLENFVLVPEGVVAVDPARIAHWRGRVPRRIALDNLALFLAQLGPDAAEAPEGMIEAYVSAGGAPTDAEEIGRRLESAHRRRIANFIAKMIRPCTALAVPSPGSLVIRALADDQDLRRWVASPSGAPPARIGDREVMVESFSGRWLPRSRRPAILTWQAAHISRCYGISTPRPIALSESPHAVTFILRDVDAPARGERDGRRLDALRRWSPRRLRPWLVP